MLCLHFRQQRQIIKVWFVQLKKISQKFFPNKRSPHYTVHSCVEIITCTDIMYLNITGQFLGYFCPLDPDP